MLVQGHFGGTLVKANLTCDWSWTTCLELQKSHSLWLPLLGLGAHENEQTAYQSQFLPAGANFPMPGKLHLSLPLPANASEAQSLKKPLVVPKLYE